MNTDYLNDSSGKYYVSSHHTCGHREFHFQSLPAHIAFEIIIDQEQNKRLYRVCIQDDFSAISIILESWLNEMLVGHRVSDCTRILKSSLENDPKFSFSLDAKQELIELLQNSDQLVYDDVNETNPTLYFPNDVSIQLDCLMPPIFTAQLLFKSNNMAIWGCASVSTAQFNQLIAVMSQEDDQFTFRVFLEGTIRSPIWIGRVTSIPNKQIILSKQDTKLPVAIAGYSWSNNISLLLDHKRYNNSANKQNKRNYSSLASFHPHKKVHNSFHSSIPSMKPDLKIVHCDVVIPYCPTNIKWLKTSVDSILNQVGANCVIHLIADGFNDPKDPAWHYAELPNIRLYRNEKKIGPYRSTNRIANRFETNYIAIHDSDDIAMPHRIAYSIRTLESQEAEMIGGAMRQFVSWETRNAESDKYVNRTPIHFSGWHKWSMSPEGIVINGTRLLTVELFLRFGGFASYMMSADCEFTTRCLRSGIKVAMSDEVIALRRVHGSSLSRGREWGIGSSGRDICHSKILESYKLMTPGFNPHEFGNLSQDLMESHLTCLLNNNNAFSRNL